ncbi:hypothetical protein F4818DRAFT_420545 [Hypoxylon cercidicola]|nr:hypothetical protein F4818DRAFT_420545 [Hypoxylon cercidicola]
MSLDSHGSWGQSLTPNRMASTGEDGRNQSDLRKALEAISCKGDFASLQAIPRLDPEIFVKDVGRIYLPLPQAQAREIIAKSHQAPFGKGSDTIVDTSVRSTWELNPGQFEIRGTSWQSELDKMLCIVQEQLGITAPITAELHKMLIYEEGAMFKAHTDTEKIPGMFGTLVVSLPSPHEGGDVVVTHCGVEKTLQTSKEDMSCLFWYSDVSHEVLPLTAGYRWVLTYNLVTNHAAELPTANNLPENPELRRALDSWSQEMQEAKIPSIAAPRYWVLDHKYTEANISYQGLKAVDRECVRYLQKMCAELDFDLFLATLEKESGTCEDEDDPFYGSYSYRHDNEDRGDYHAIGVCDVSYRSKYIFDLSGNKLAANVPLDANKILHGKNPFKGKPDEEDYEEYMGNSGPQATHWYRLSALIIVPCKSTLPLLGPSASASYSRSTDIEGLCNFFVTKHRNFPQNNRPLLQLHKLLAVYTEDSIGPKMALSGDCLFKVLQASIHGNEPGLLDFVLSNNKQPHPTEFFSWIKEEYDSSAISIEDFQKLFTYGLGLHTTIFEDFEAIYAVSGGVETTDEVRDMISDAVDDRMVSYRKWELQEEDGPALFDLSLSQRDFNHLKDVVIPIVEKRSGRTAFVLGFLEALQQSMERGQIPHDEALGLYERVALKALEKLELTSITAFEPFSQKTPTMSKYEYPPRKPEQPPATNYMTYDLMLGFFSTLIMFRFEEHPKLFSEKIRLQARRIKSREFNRFWLPFLQGLFPVFKQHQIKLTAPRRMYQSILQAYLLNYVEELPLKPSLSRPTVRCSCGDCHALNRFLIDPNERVGRFPMAERRRRHVEACLSRYYVDCKTATEACGSPYTLVMTKTTKHHEADVDAWRKRRLRAENQLGAFDRDMLETILADQFDDIMSMKHLEREEEPAAQNGAAPADLAGIPVDQLVQPKAETADMTFSSSMLIPTSNLPTLPKPEGMSFGVAMALSSRRTYPWKSARDYSSTSDISEEPPPKRPMLEVSRRISQYANQVRASRIGSNPRNASSSKSSTSGRGYTSTGMLPRPTADMAPNLNAGMKRKRTEVETIDLTGGN